MISPLENLSVLVIDDDSNTVKVLSEFLELKNIKVVRKGFYFY